MTFDPDTVKPSKELMAERLRNARAWKDDYIFFARWGAAQALRAAAAQMIKTDDLTDIVEDVFRGAERHHQAGRLCTIATELEGSDGPS